MTTLKAKEKRLFNVNSKEDLEAFSKYFTSGKWGPDGCPFILEEPFTNVPYMCKFKIVSKFLKV